jgi:predicted kinase
MNWKKRNKLRKIAKSHGYSHYKKYYKSRVIPLSVRVKRAVNKIAKEVISDRTYTVDSIIDYLNCADRL